MALIRLADSSRPRPNSDLAAHRASATEGEAAKRLLEDQGYPVKRVTNGQLETRCPFHEGPGEIERGKGTNFYVNAKTSVYNCHSASCGERGNLKTLERYFGIDQEDGFTTAYQSREEKLQQFERCLVKALRTPFYEHGLTDQTIERFRLGYELEHTNEDGVKIPSRYVIPYLDGRRPKFFRYYSPNTGQADYDPKWKYTWEKGAESTLFNAQDAMGDKDGRVFLCEGEQKAMLLVQLGYAAVAVPGASQWRDEFQAAFTHARHIVVLYDNDNPEFHIYDKPEKNQLCVKCVGAGRDRCAGHNPGQDAAVQRVEQLGWRAKNIVLPLPEGAPKTDVNDYFMRDGYTNADFAELCTGKRATPFKVLSLAEISAAPPEEPEFLIEGGILPRAGRLLVAGKPKIGKAQPLTSPVLTPTGWTTMGELRAGDQVIGVDGLPAKVRKIHPQGTMPIYRVTMSDGSSTECTGEHLWTVQSHNDRIAGRHGRTIDTNTIAGMLKMGRTRDTHLPIVAPVVYATQEPLPIHPYAMGILLVSASLRGTPSVGSLPLYDGLVAALPDLSVKIVGNKVIHLTGPEGARANPLTQELRQLELMDTRTWDRHIPLPYLTATPTERLALLQGLLDGSGWVQVNSNGNTSAHISTGSPFLRDGITELVESLGGVVRTRLRAAPKHQNGRGRPSWLMTVRLPASMEPFRLAEKANRWRSGRTSKNTGPLRKIVAVDYVRDDEAQCITIDRPDGLYVTERFIVTHNSIFVDNLALSLASGIPFLSQFKIANTNPAPGHRVLLLDRELSKSSLFKRMNDLMDYRNGYRTAMDNLLIDHDHLLRFDQADAYEVLLQLVEQNGAEVVILDTAYKFFAGDVESSSALSKGFAVLDKVIHETDVAVVLTHHLKKGQGGKLKENTDVADPDAVAGSFLWTGWPNATVLLNYLNRSVENPYNAIATFTAFRDGAPPEPLALYRDRTSIAYQSIQPYSHEENPAQRAPIEQGRPTTDAIGTLLLEACEQHGGGITEPDFLHIAAARWGVSAATIRPFYIDVLSAGHFTKSSARPPVITYKYAGPPVQSWEQEHGLKERPIPTTTDESMGDLIQLFDAAALQTD